MKKKDLIDLLSDLSDEDEVVVWNGYVDDYNDISPEITPLQLVKERLEWIYLMLSGEFCEHNKRLPTAEEDEKIMEEAKRCYEEHNDWDTPNQFFDEERFKRAYEDDIKTLYVLDLKTRGKSTWDRAGTLHY